MRVRPIFLIALSIAALLLGLDRIYLTGRLAYSKPSPTPKPRPHFAVDDLDLGPGVHLTHFDPTIDLYQDDAAEGTDGRLYVAYSPARPPGAWGQHLDDAATRIGIINDGRIQPITPVGDSAIRPSAITPILLRIVGIFAGMPVVRVGGARSRHLDAVSRDGFRRISIDHGIVPQPWPCIAFDDGSICQENDGGGFTVKFASSGGSKEIVASAPGRGYRDVLLIGGGRHRFLIAEYHFAEGAAECVEGFAP